MQALIGHIIDFRLYFGKYPKVCRQLIDTVKQNLIYIRLFVESSLEEDRSCWKTLLEAIT